MKLVNKETVYVWYLSIEGASHICVWYLHKTVSLTDGQFLRLSVIAILIQK